MLGRNVLILEIVGFFESLIEDALRRVRERRLCGRAGNFRQAFDLTRGFGQYLLRLRANALEHRHDDAFLIADERREQVHRLQLRIAVLRGKLDCALDRLLCLYCGLIPTNCHIELSATLTGRRIMI